MLLSETIILAKLISVNKDMISKYLFFTKGFMKNKMNQISIGIIFVLIAINFTKCNFYGYYNDSDCRIFPQGEEYSTYSFESKKM